MWRGCEAFSSIFLFAQHSRDEPEKESMSRITREQFVSTLSDEGAGSGGIAVDPALASKLEKLGIGGDQLRRLAGSDGIINSKEELGRLFDLVDTLDHDGSRGSIATTKRDASGHEQATLSGAAFSALEQDLADARLHAHLGAPPPLPRTSAKPDATAVTGAPPPPPPPPASAAAKATPAKATTGNAPAGKIDKDEVARDLARFEGSKSYMYQDSRGFITTGVGHLLKTAADAEKLPWINSATGKLATKAEIDAAFAHVEDMPTGRKADAYKLEGGLVLPDGKAEELARKRLDNEFLPGLRKLYPEFDSFPPSAQRALIDMAYNCGLGGLAKFHHLADAVAKQDWAAAAAACHRKSCREERNEWTHDMFMAAVNEKKTAKAAP
jgi:GH24 family phage-related lysozyme (muramidase)